MIKKLVRHGNSRALVIDKPILELLKCTEETAFEITTDGDSLTIRPIREEEARRIEFELAAEEALKQYGTVFERLAE